MIINNINYNATRNSSIKCFLYFFNKTTHDRKDHKSQDNPHYRRILPWTKSINPHYNKLVKPNKGI